VSKKRKFLDIPDSFHDNFSRKQDTSIDYLVSVAPWLLEWSKLDG